MWRSIVLQAAIARQSALAARAWEDFGSSIAEEGSQKPDSCNSQLGDTFHAASEILLPLDVVWLALAVLAVLVVLLCTQQLGLHVDESSGPEKFPGTQWYRAGFSSLTSHAAGIVGFVGFQKIVVARIVALSDTCDLWSLHNFLLYTTLALSVVAVSASFVFLGVDYARRLAIDAAKQKGFRLVLKAKKLENTGMGLAIIALGGLMVLLYALVILKEASQQKKHIDHKWLLLDTVCGGGTVLLFYLNLRGLYQSPKVQFDAMCHEADERITLEEFLEMHSITVRDGPSSLATFLERVAGEDLALLATRGTRRAILPNQRWAPLVHVVCGLLLLGAFPLVVHLGANSLFAKPKLEDLKALTGTVLEISESSDGSDVWFWNAPTSKQFLFLNSEAAKLQVTPTYQQTSRIELCCPSLQTDCERERLNHSLIKFFKEPVVLSVPYRSNSSADCKLTLHGLSSRSETTFEIRIESKVQHHLCDCSLEGCPCCGGFHGELKFSNLSKNLSKLGLNQSSELLRNVCKNASCESVNNTNGKSGTECACGTGYVGKISWDGPDPKGPCTAAECNFPGSNGVSGPNCDCAEGFEGKPHWNRNRSWIGNCHPAECDFYGSNNLSGPNCGCAEGFEGRAHWLNGSFTGNCHPAECNFYGSNGVSGANCDCGDGFEGRARWLNGSWTGNCHPAECNFYGSNNLAGPNCGCANGFEGEPHWNVNGSWTGNCRPAECAVANSIGQGLQCQCEDGFQGSIVWRGPNATGSCEPASCASISDSNGIGTDCRCANGFTGNISWNGAAPSGNCTPAPCEKIQNSNRQLGPSCKCDDGFDGEIKWEGDQARGKCSPAACEVPNSTHDPGWKCKCENGFKGDITWFGSDAQGHCDPAPCNVENSTKAPGLQCECLYKYDGLIWWDGPNVSGTCSPVACLGDRLNGMPGPACQCKDGFAGEPHYTPHEASFYSFILASFSGRTCEPAECKIPNSTGRGINCKCDDMFVGKISWQGAVAHGECTPAPCNVENSNKKPGPECACLYGYAGHLQYSENLKSMHGECIELPCEGEFSNQKSGPNCACADGYNGTVSQEMNDIDGDGFPIKRPHMWVFRCEPAACDVDGSTGDGLECHCRDGFEGQITWEGPRAKGFCRPAPCSVANSNQKNGTDCKCLDGYDGGPYCRCLRGFYGAITWKGNQSEGQCLPTPQCSHEIIHTASLVTDVNDSRGKLCRAGERLVFHGQKCSVGNIVGRIEWTSAHSVEPERCEWTWSSTPCGQAPMNESVLPLPLECSSQPAQPRCDSNIRYSITSIGQLDCPNPHGNEPIVVNGTHLLEFQGRQCGYDLILWKSVTVPNFPSCMANLSLKCGEEIGMHLPKACRNIAQAASFVGSIEASPTAIKQLTGEPWPSDSSYSNHQALKPSTWHFIAKFFDDGECSIEGFSALIGMVTAWKSPWWADGRYLVLPGKNGAGAYLEKLPNFPDGSRFIRSGPYVQLTTTSPLPLWWSFKFQQNTTVGGNAAFNTDTLNACHLHLFLNGMCYEMTLGWAVRVFHTTKSNCPSPNPEVEMIYGYKYSKYGAQTYQSRESCVPHAAHHQLELEIVDIPSVGSRKQSPFLSSSMDGECRTVVRYVVDVQKLHCHSKMMKIALADGGRVNAFAAQKALTLN